MGRQGKMRREWQSTPVFFPGEFHGQRSLAGHSPRGLKEADRSEQLTHAGGKMKLLHLLSKLLAQYGTRGRKWKCSSLSCVWLFVALWTVTCQAPLSMEFSRQEYRSWVAIPFFRGSSTPRDWTWVSCIAGKLFTIWATREAPWDVWVILPNPGFQYWKACFCLDPCYSYTVQI